MEDLLFFLPFNSYSDIFNAIKNKKATLRINRSDCYKISSIKHSKFTTIGMFFGFATTLLLLLGYCYLYNNYWVLLLVPINFMLAFLIGYFSKLKTIAWIILFFNILFIENTIISICCIDIIVISFFDKIWWNRIYKYAIQEMYNNSEIFLWAWNRYGITIEDCFGNSYSKYNLMNTN